MEHVRADVRAKHRIGLRHDRETDRTGHFGVPPALRRRWACRHHFLSPRLGPRRAVVACVFSHAAKRSEGATAPIVAGDLVILGAAETATTPQRPVDAVPGSATRGSQLLEAFGPFPLPQYARLPRLARSAELGVVEAVPALPTHLGLVAEGYFRAPPRVEQRPDLLDVVRAELHVGRRQRQGLAPRR